MLRNKEESRLPALKPLFLLFDLTRPLHGGVFPPLFRLYLAHICNKVAAKVPIDFENNAKHSTLTEQIN